MSSAGKLIVCKLDSIRDGVTDFGRTTMPRPMAYEMRTVAGEALCFSAILIRTGSLDSGEPAVSIGRQHEPSRQTYQSSRAASKPG